MAKTTVALTSEATAVLDTLKERFKLPEIVDYIRLGFGYAVSEGLDLERPADFSTPGGQGNTTTSTATLDYDQQIQQLTVSVFGDVDDPYHAIETLANKGILQIAAKLEAGDIGSLTDLMDGRVDG